MFYYLSGNRLRDFSHYFGIQKCVIMPVGMTEQDKQVEILKRKSTAERLKSAFGLFDFARQRITAEIRRLNPQIKASELIELVNQRFAR